MANFVRCSVILRSEIKFLKARKCMRHNRLNYCSKKDEKSDENDGEFRVLQIKPEAGVPFARKEMTVKMSPPRTEKMSTDQDWTNVWPAPKTFHPAVVPLPVRQGINWTGPSPDKYANAELMKIPNFLHLTPAAIKKQCDALKKFCTPWPESLKTNDDIDQHFPVEIVHTDYCHSSPTIRDPMARIISLKINIKHLKLDYHAQDKFLRLVGERYNPATGIVTITTDSCPMKKQNYEYAQYLLTALVYESWKYEDWEKEKQDEDMEVYIYSKRKASEKVRKTFEYNNRELPQTTEFAKAVENWHNEAENVEAIEKYKEACLKLLSLPSF